MKRAISLALAAIMSLCVLASCGSNDPSDDSPKATDPVSGTTADGASTEKEPEVNTGSDETQTETEANTDSDETQIETEANTDSDSNEINTDVKIPEFNDKNSDISVGLTANKVGSFSAKHFYTADGGVYYSDDSGKYGIMSHDGKTDTGAIFDYCTSKYNYFAVTTNSPTDVGNIDALNCAGIVDGTGKVIVPEEYASLKVLNDRYIQAIKVTDRAESKEDALVYYSEELSLFPDEDDLFFTGVWYIYDATTGKMIDGITGTNNIVINAYGNYLKFYNEDNTKTIISGDGKTLPEDVVLFDNGSYILDNCFYDSDDTPLFTYEPGKVVPSYVDDDYVIAVDRSGDSSKVMMLDRTGQVVSAPFNSSIYAYGSMITSDPDPRDNDYDDNLYDFAGNLIINEKVSQLYHDELTGDVWAVCTPEDKYIVITADGTVLYECTETDDVSYDQFYFAMKKKVGDENYVYCLKDKDFTISGFSFAPWLAKVEGDDYKYDIVDTISGETIISGYSYYSYDFVYSDDEPVIYVYARTGNDIDIYAVK